MSYLYIVQSRNSISALSFTILISHFIVSEKKYLATETQKKTVHVSNLKRIFRPIQSIIYFNLARINIL